MNKCTWILEQGLIGSKYIGNIQVKEDLEINDLLTERENAYNKIDNEKEKGLKAFKQLLTSTSYCAKLAHKLNVKWSSLGQRKYFSSRHFIGLAKKVKLVQKFEPQISLSSIF